MTHNFFNGCTRIKNGGFLRLYLFFIALATVGSALFVPYSMDEDQGIGVRNLTLENESDWDISKYNFSVTPPVGSDLVIKKGPLAYIANGGVLVIDTSTHTQLAQINMKYGASYVALSPDDSVLYAVAGGKQYLEGIGAIDQSFLTLVNTTTNEEMGYVDLGYNLYPKQVAVGPDGKVYVSWQKTSAGYPGYYVFDFKNNLKWEKQFGEYNEYLASSFAFSPDGKHAYMGMQNPYAAIYDLDWNENKAYIIRIYPEMGSLRSITPSKNANNIYYVDWYKNRIGYMRTTDYNLQVWNEDYRPTDLVYSQKNSALYVVGYQNSVPKLYKLTGLMGISTIGGTGGTENFITHEPDSFYSSSQSVYLSMPQSTVPSHIEITPDEEYLYITNLEKSTYSDYDGNAVVVYDAQSLQKVAEIKSNGLYRFADLAIAKNKVVWDPAPEFELLQGIQINPVVNVFEAIDTPYVTSTSPDRGSDNVPINAQIAVTFSKEIDPLTVNESTLIVLNSHYYPINGTRGAKGNVAYFIPSENYTKNSKVFVTTTNGIKSTKGTEALWENFEFSIGNESAAYVVGLQELDLGTRTNIEKMVMQMNTSNNTQKSNITGKLSLPAGLVEAIRNQTHYTGDLLVESDAQEVTPEGNELDMERVEANSDPLPSNVSEHPQYVDPEGDRNTHQPETLENAEQGNNGTGPTTLPPGLQSEAQTYPPAQEKSILESALEFFRSIFGF